MSRHVRRLWKAIHKLGLINGCVVWYYYVYHRLLPSRKWSLREVRLNNALKPVWMRPGVSDWIVMERIFLDQEYASRSGLHEDAVDRRQGSIVAGGGQPLIIDCGANIGLSSVWLAQRFPGAIVVSIEPEPSNFEILSLNARNFPNIIPLHAAVSDRMSRVTLSNSENTPWAWKTHESASGEVETVTIPHVIGLNSNYVLMAVKVDIEGFEVNLFRDGAAWVDDLPLLVFEMHDWLAPWSGSGHSFFSVLSRQERDYLVRGENVFSYSRGVLRNA